MDNFQIILDYKNPEVNEGMPMNLLLEKNEQRDLTILSLLYSEERWWSLEELAQNSECSVGSANRSVQHLLDLSENLENVFEIILKQKQGVFLKMSDNYSISQLQEKYFRETFSYKIVDQIFCESELTIEKLMDKFYVSRSTIYRKLKSIEYMFQQNQLTFDKSTLKLGGSELNLREFFFVFYWSIAKNGEWPFTSVNKEVLDFRLKSMLKETKIQLSSIEYMQVLYRLAINFVQHAKKQYITELPETVQLDPYRFVFIEKLGSKLVEFVPRDYQKTEFAYLGLIFSTYPYTDSDPDEAYLQKIVSWYQAENQLTNQFISAFCHRLESDYPENELMKLLQQPKVLFMMMTITNYSLLFPNLYIQKELPSSWRMQLERLEKNVPVFYENIWQVVKEVQETDPFRGKMLDPSYIVYGYLALFSQNFDVSLFERVIKIKLICAADPVSEFALSQQLKSLMGYNTLVFNSNYREDTQVLYDLVISDLKIATSNQPQSRYFYLWNFPPTTRDWLNVKNILDQLVLEK